MANPIQQLVRRVTALEDQAAGFAGGPQLAYSSLEDGALLEYDGVGTLVSVLGKQFDGTHTHVTFAGPPPPDPAAAQLTPGPLSLTVRWSGRFAGDALSPMDFQHVEVHISTDPGFDASDTSTLRATLRGELGDEVVISPLSSVPHYVRLVARSLAGKASPPSVVAEGTPDAIATSTDDGKITVEARPPTVEDGEGKPENALWNQVDPVTGKQVAVWRWDGAAWVDFPISETMLPKVNIAEGTYGKLKGVQLEANAINGMLITGAIIQTSTAPDRGLKFTETDLVAYNGDGDQTFRLDASTGEASFLGRIRSGSTIEGATITGGSVKMEAGNGYSLGMSAYNSAAILEFRTPSSAAGTYYGGSIRAEEDMYFDEVRVQTSIHSPTSGKFDKRSFFKLCAGRSTNLDLGKNGYAYLGANLLLQSVNSEVAIIGDINKDMTIMTQNGDIDIRGKGVKVNGRDIGTNTGNVNCTIKPGFTMQSGKPPTARKDGNRTYINWGINAAGFTPNSITVFATLPPGFAPIEWKYFPVTSSNVAAGGMLVVKSNGELELRTPATVGSYYIFDAVSWFSDS